MTPPAPFSGTARFERVEGENGTWSGDLAVNFPDAFDLPMAGDHFEATFHSALLEGLSR